MDFRTTQKQIEAGKLDKSELFHQIQNLPCLYGLLENQQQIFCLDLQNQDNSEIITVLPIYSNFELAMNALEQFNIIPGDYSNSFIAHWTDIHEVLNMFMKLELNSCALDLTPESEDGISGLILDQPIINDLITFLHSSESV